MSKENKKEKREAVKNNKAEKRSSQLKIASQAYNSKYKPLNPGPLYAWPMGLWFTIFFVTPIIIIICYSFMKRDVYGGVISEFSLKAYNDMLSPDYGKILLRTLWMTFLSTTIAILLALPSGYAMARSNHQTLLLILIIVPFLTNSLIRIFAWITILGDNGILNSLLKLIFNLFHSPQEEFIPHKFMYTQGAVILVNVYMYLPYAILPIFTAVDRFDFSLIEAARDLGASKPKAMFKILIPGIKSGIISSLIFTFIPIFGTYTVPQLVGGKDSYMIGNIIVDQVQKVRNWPLASAFSVILTLISMFAILWMLTSNKQDAKLKEVSNKEEII